MRSEPAPASRSTLLEEVLARLSGRGPRVTVLSGPRGWGKGEMLETVSRRLASAGIHPITLDASRCAIHPGEFACALAVRCLETALGEAPGDAVAAAGPSPAEERLRALAERGSVKALGPDAASAVDAILRGLDSASSPGAEMVRTALDLPGRLAGAAGGPVVVIVRAMDHLSRLSPFPGLRGVERILAAALGHGSVRVAASVSPEGRPGTLLEALREALGDEIDEIPLPPLDARQVRALWSGGEDPGERLDAVVRLTGGRLLTARILAQGLAGGRSLQGLLSSEMEPGEGRLYQELRFDYHLLIERTRGHAACRSALNILAREEGLDLTGVASRLRRSPGSTLDYLRWLAEVGLIRREGRRYVFTDPLLRLHVLLDQVPEHPGDAAGRTAVIRRFLAGMQGPRIELRPLGRPRGSGKGTRRRPPPSPPAPPAPGPPDELMEID